MIESSAEWLRGGLTVLFGALAGGITNRIAIWMLFHPARPPRLFGRPIHRLQGAIPKNQERLARTIGQTVGTRLLTPEDLSAELRDPTLETAFQQRLGELLANLLGAEGPTLAELLPAPVLAELEEVLRELLDEAHAHIVRALESPGFAQETERLLAELRSGLGEEPISEALPPETTGRLRERVDAWLERLVDSEAFERTVQRHLRHAAERILRPGRTLEELIPAGLVGTVEHAIQNYLPVAMERLGRLLEDPDARSRVEHTVHELLDRFMADLKFHQRVVAKLIITEETVERVLRTLEAEGADQLADLLREAEVQSAMARSVNEAVVEFLRRPTTRVLGSPEDPQVESGLRAIGDWILRAARDPTARRFLLEQGEEAALRLGTRSWGEALELLPPDRIGAWLAAALRSEPGRAVYARMGEDFLQRVLHRPGAGFARLVREEAVNRLAAAIAPAAWEWISGEIPKVAERVRISERVEEKIAGYPLGELERLVRSVTQRELDLIVRLGYLLGATIGGGLVLVTAFLS